MIGAQLAVETSATHHREANYNAGSSLHERKHAQQHGRTEDFEVKRGISGLSDGIGTPRSPSVSPSAARHHRSPSNPSRNRPSENLRSQIQTQQISDNVSRPSTTLSSKKSAWSKWKLFLGLGDWEPKTIDFLELCTARYPGSQWEDLHVFQQVALIRDALKPAQFLLNPHCSYIKYWDMLVLFALCYTSIVTPYEVGFLETKLNGLFYWNRCIDLIFFKDMIMQFSLKVQKTTQKGTVWIKDRKTIVRNYLKGWFFLDLLSILPFDIVGLAFNDPNVKRLKVIRVVRLLRLLKLVRVLRASRIIKRWQNSIATSFAVQGLCKFILLLALIAHWMSCIWGMIGYLLGTDLDCETGEMDPEIEHTKDGVSWITVHSWGPDSPCRHFDVYLSALHFSVMTITSIGYGDITPTRKEENAVCILCQLFGGLTWAYVIGSICGIIANSNPTKVAFEQSMDALNSMLAEQDVEYPLRWKLREFLREQQYHHFLLRARNISDNFSPSLQTELTLQTAIGHAITKVWYFRDCGTSFVVEVAQCLKCAQFCPRDQVGALGTLSIVQRGSVARSGRILLPGNFWGEDMIVTSIYLCDETPGITLNYVELLSLRKHELDEILVDYPQVEVKIRKAAVLIAFRIAVRIVARESIQKKKSKNVAVSHSTSSDIDTETHLPPGMSRANTYGLTALFDSLDKGTASISPKRLWRGQSALELIGSNELEGLQEKQDNCNSDPSHVNEEDPVAPDVSQKMIDKLDLMLEEFMAFRKELLNMKAKGVCSSQSVDLEDVNVKWL